MHWLLGLEHVIAGCRCLEVSGVSPWSHGRCRPFSLLFPGSAPQGPEAGSAGHRGFVAYFTGKALAAPFRAANLAFPGALHMAARSGRRPLRIA